MQMLDLATARKIADTALADGLKRGVAKTTIVVTDASGEIRVALRADAAGAFGVEIARGKARTALGFATSTIKLAQVFGNSASATAAVNAATGNRFVPLGGGVQIANSEGQVVGAAAMSGGQPEVDDEVITAAVRAAGFNVP